VERAAHPHDRGRRPQAGAAARDGAKAIWGGPAPGRPPAWPGLSAP